MACSTQADRPAQRRAAPIGPAGPIGPMAAKPPVDEWAAMTWEDRHDTMTWAVLPVMARAFQRWKHSDAPTLTCRTCHGPDGEARGYKMPSPSLRALDPDHLPRSAAATFMTDEVVPTMRELLGKPSLSCFSCHRRGAAP
jgi:hypothetical protein